MNIGAHVSIAGGITNAPGNAAAIGCECFQIFTRSPRGGPARPITTETGEAFRAECRRYGLADCYIHTPYYINLASTDRRIADSSVKVVREELERGCAVGARAVMTHLGSTGASRRDVALRRVSRNIRKILKNYEGKTQLLLELAAGSGSIVGSSFEELALVTRDSDGGCGVCLDTQHMFASGYDIRGIKKVTETFDRFDEVVGMGLLQLIHANDSKVPSNSRRDRHEHIGEGKIGKQGFRALIADKRLSRIDFILETRHDRVADDIRLLKSLRG